MPKYLTIGSKFNPFSYQEMLAPVAQATQAHQGLEEAYGELASKASVWDGMTDNELDKDTHQKYLKYSEDLNSLADKLAKEGLNQGSRKDAMNMRSRYSSEIIPIETAYNKRLEDVKNQLELRARDNTIMFDKDASKTRLSEYMSNPALSYTPVSGGLITKRSAEVFSQLKDQLTKEGTWKSTALGQLLEKKDQYGLTWNDVKNIIKRDPSSYPEMQQQMQEIINSTGIQNWGDNQALNNAWEYALEGAFAGLGTTKFNYQRNEDYLNPLERKRLDQEALPNTQLPYRAVPSVSVDASKKTSELKSDLDFLTQVMQDPSILNKQEVTNSVVYTSSQGIPIFSSPTVSRLNEERLRKIEKTYDINFGIGDYDENTGTRSGNAEYTTKQFTDAMGKLRKDIASSAEREQSYLLNFTDNKYVNKMLPENSEALFMRSGRTGFKKIKDGKIGDDMNQEEVAALSKKNKPLGYDPNFGFYIPNSDGEPSAFVDFELITPDLYADEQGNPILVNGKKINHYQFIHNYINELIDAGDYKQANYYKDLLLQNTAFRINNMYQIQGETNNKNNAE